MSCNKMRASFILTSLLWQSLVCRGPSKSSILCFNPKALPLENFWLWVHTQRMAARSDQHDLSGLEGVLGFLHAGGGTPVQSKGPGVWKRVRREISARRRPAQRQVWLGRHNSIRLSDKGTRQSQDLGWGMRVELSRGLDLS